MDRKTFLRTSSIAIAGLPFITLDLVTQIYFEGDEYIESDPWASEAEDSRIIELAEKDGVLTGRFDINLQLGK